MVFPKSVVKRSSVGGNKRFLSKMEYSWILLSVCGTLAGLYFGYQIGFMKGKMEIMMKTSKEGLNKITTFFENIKNEENL